MKTKSTTVKRIPNDWHSHTCQCGYRWAHSDNMVGNEGAHRCPKCGSLCWWKDFDTAKPKDCDYIGCGAPQLIERTT